MIHFRVWSLFFWLSSIILVSNAELPPFFIFGDSLVDVGNNNYIFTNAKANIEPNGIDFIQQNLRPTGRFTNGRTVIDIIGDEFGYACYPPPYLSPNSNRFATTCGVNFASGAAGILNETGYIFIGRINLDAQIDNFANTRKDLISILGMENAMALIKRSMFFIIIGSNDFLANYLLPVLSDGEQKLVPPEVFIQIVITRFQRQLERLHTLGARKIAVGNIGPIGCTPVQREFNPLAGNDCAAYANQLAMSFNTRIKHLIIELNSKHNEATFLYVNIYHVVSDLLQNFMRYGFEVIDTACCSVGGGFTRFGGVVPCGPTSTYCANREEYFFWDPFHPSEAANKLIAKRIIDGDDEDSYPMNLRKLMQL